MTDTTDKTTVKKPLGGQKGTFSGFAFIE